MSPYQGEAIKAQLLSTIHGRLLMTSNATSPVSCASIFTRPKRDMYDCAVISPPLLVSFEISDFVEKTAPFPLKNSSQEICRFLQFERVI